MEQGPVMIPRSSREQSVFHLSNFMEYQPLTKEERLRVEVLLIVHTAFLGEIGVAVRAISCSWNSSNIKISIVHDREVSDDDLESAGDVEAEVLAAFPNHTVDIECSRVDLPHRIPLPISDTWIFVRRD